ncbi:MAG TPA: hypothetical protein VEH29_06580 [Acidimicrobiales bacterium]|nr:hypothetical protein [Acidimicrobiales bacterium]
MQGRRRVLGEDGDPLLGEDGAVVDRQGGHVHRAARLARAGGERLLHGMPTLERRQQGGVSVQDPPWIGSVDRAAEHSAVPRHRQEPDVITSQGAHDLVGEALAVEVAREACAQDPLHRDARIGRDALRPAGAVDDDGGDGEPSGDEGLENRAAAGRKDGDSHEPHGISAVRRAGTRPDRRQTTPVQGSWR